MIKAILFDFSRVLVFPIHERYTGSLNELHKEHQGRADYNVFQLFRLNIDLLTFLETVSHKVSLYILTTETIQEAPEFAEYLHPTFKKIYSALQIGLSKKDPAIYQWVGKDLNLYPEEILFIDDTEANIQAAKQAGLETIYYKSNNELIEELQNFML